MIESTPPCLCRRNIKERLEKELERNLALRVEPGETADMFIVSGRGALHISILIENMRCASCKGRRRCPLEDMCCHAQCAPRLLT